MNKKNPYLVERATEVDFLAEPGDPVLTRELAKAAEHGAALNRLPPLQFRAHFAYYHFGSF